MDKILANEEIRSLFTAMGTGFGADFDVSKARYQKLVIMTDADVDGAHIRTLLLTLIYRFMRPVLEAGYVYIAQPPIYGVKVGSEIKEYIQPGIDQEDQLKQLLKNIVLVVQNQLFNVIKVLGKWMTINFGKLLWILKIV